MKRIGAMTLAVAMTVTACGGSNETAPEPDVEVEAVDKGVAREASDDFYVIKGCRIEPFGHTECPRANLQDADLVGVELSGANLQGTNLRNADLRAAILRGANMSGADLSGVNLAEARNSEALFCNTIMPDGSVSNDNC